MRLHRSWTPRVGALLVALVALLLVPGAAAADSYYQASCNVILRSTPSMTGAPLVTMPSGTVVTVTGTVSGGSWSASACPTSVSGTTWYQISAVGGASVEAFYGTGVAYAASGLFAPSPAPPPPPPSYLPGIDVSHYQGTVDWPSVAATGKRFVIAQATVGDSWVDPTYAANHAGARAAGLLVTAYHFAEPSGGSPAAIVQDAVTQADWFAVNAALVPGDLVPALDLEQTGNLGPVDLQTWVGAWLQEVSTRLGVRPMIYTSPDFWANEMGGTTIFADQGYTVLWVAHWGVSSPIVPANGWSGHGWTFWQYTSSGLVPGISGRVDLDFFNGTDLSPLQYNYVPVPPPAPQPSVPPVVTAVWPSTAAAGGGDLAVSIEGGNFAPGESSAYWNGTGLSTTYVSPSQLTAIVPAALTATPGTGSLTVINQPPGGGVSAPATFTVTAPAAQLSLTASSGVIAWGQPVTLTVQFASSGAGRSVAIGRMQANEKGWTTIATLTADSTGLASFTYSPPTNTQFEAAFAGAPDLGAGTSAPVGVLVRQTIALRPTGAGSIRQVRAGTGVTFTATVRPIGYSAAPATVVFGFWRLVSGRWQAAGTRTVAIDSAGRASTKWTFASRGQWYVRAVANPTSTSTNSAWSPLERYSVF